MKAKKYGKLLVFACVTMLAAGALALEPEDAAFLKNFVLKSGSLKEIARLYEVSYPTVRLRLDKLIQKIELSDQKEEEPFSTFIKGLAVD